MVAVFPQPGGPTSSSISLESPLLDCDRRLKHISVYSRTVETLYSLDTNGAEGVLFIEVSSLKYMQESSWWENVSWLERSALSSEVSL